MKTYCIQNDGDCETCSLVSYGRDCENIPLSLYAKRQELTDQQQNLYDPSDFPGSAEWKKHNTALKAVTTFDAEHPEIKAELKAQRKTKDAKIAEEADWI